MKFLKFFLIIFFLIFLDDGICNNKAIILATTTSIENSGLLDELIPIFQKKSGYRVKTIAVGSGQAIMLGRKGEADILLVHSEEDEEKFMKDSLGIQRRQFLYNDFILVGPADDPAGAKKSKDIFSAFKKIADKEKLFISRGDNSGTHKKELSIWKSLNIDTTRKRWYQEAGLGMGETLNIADEKKGYTLTDRATYLTLKKNLKLKVLVEDKNNLKNNYSIIIVNPNLFKKVNYEGAKALADFLISKESKKLIEDFNLKKYNEPAFIPF